MIEGYYSIPHTVGTCRMGPSADEGGVVDALGRVHGIDGLSVIDASIIPDATSGFPHIVTIMLADLLAERLLVLPVDATAMRGRIAPSSADGVQRRGSGGLECSSLPPWSLGITWSTSVAGRPQG